MRTTRFVHATRTSPPQQTLRGGAVALLLALAVPAQEALFFQNHNLAKVPPLHQDVGAAIRHLCRGPSTTEIANGYYSNVPPGTQLLAWQRTGSSVRLVFDTNLLTATPGCELEHAIEQIDKTTLNAPGVDRVLICVRQQDGSEPLLGDVLGRQPLPITPQPPSGGVPSGGGLVSPFGILSGKRIAVSPGHGYYWHSTLGWTTQRGLIDGLIEDIHTAEIANRFLIPLLENMGAEIVFCREHGQRSVDGLVDNDGGGPAYSETGSWTTSASSGYQNGTYRFVSSNPGVETATATWQIPVQEDGLYPVFAWFRASGNRTPAATYRIHHTGGIATAIVDQTIDNLTWAHLGNYWFSTAAGARIVLSNQSSQSGVVIADTVRLGGGLGSLVRGGTTSNQARWRECARYWAQFAGAPSSVWDSIASGQDNSDDVTARPRFAEWRTADAFVSLHTNAGGGTGTDTFVYSGGATAGSAALSQAVHTQIVSDLRTFWNPAWYDRGQKQANFGELRLLSTMPGILVELAFHDSPGSLDHVSLHDPEFRYLAARACARGVLRYFSPLSPFPPEPPTALRVTQDGARGLRVAWDAAPGATSYTIERSDDGKGFAEVASVTGTSWSTGPLPLHSWASFRVRAWNVTGRSFPTEVLTAGTDHLATAQLLLVQGFDRLDRYVKQPENTRDYLHRFGDACRGDADFSLGFDAASNEAVELGRVGLSNYDAVVWSLGEESTVDESFGAQEQALITSYLNGGGGLLVSGAEVGWDLDAQGSASDRAFYRNVLGATYVADDAGVYSLQAGVPGTVSAGLASATFDNGSGATYNVDYPDVLAPTNGNSSVCLRYGNGLVAGIQKVDPQSGGRVVTLGLPLETITSATTRARLLQQCLLFLLDDLPLRGPRTATLGQSTAMQLRLPGEAGLPYIFALSAGYAPGTGLPLGGLLPLNNDPLLQASISQGSPFFVDFVGQLDATGAATPTLVTPYLPFLDGLPLYFAGFSLLPTAPLERRVSNWIRITLTL